MAFKDWVFYQKFDPDFLLMRKHARILDLYQMVWPTLVIEVMPALSLPILVVYSGQAANSHQLVKLVSTHKNSVEFKTFSCKSKHLVNALHQTWPSLSAETLMPLMQSLQDQLAQLAHFCQAPLISSSMLHIMQLIQAHQGVMKFSGAGGGDCVLGVFKTSDELILARGALEAEGFETFIIQKEVL